MPGYRPVPENFEDRISDELKTLMEFPAYQADNMQRFRSLYAEAGAQPERLRYGWLRSRGA
jgi:hypothetical protein